MGSWRMRIGGRRTGSPRPWYGGPRPRKRSIYGGLGLGRSGGERVRGGGLKGTTEGKDADKKQRGLGGPGKEACRGEGLAEVG